MKINRLSLDNFLVFTGHVAVSDNDFQEGTFNLKHGSFDENFIDGINVFIGANGTGKSTLLKCIYAACEFSNQTTHPAKAKKFSDYFSSSKNTIIEINQKQSDDNFGLVQVFCGEHEFHYRAWDNGFLNLRKWMGLEIKSVLIPSAEMLSHSKGLIPMSLKSNIPFDCTQIDILVNAQIWETKEISDRNKKILELIGKAIDGEVVYENDTFYTIKSNGLKVEFSMEADGFKKLGLLWILVRNGLLESGSILLWDEPEASINPELMPLVADVLHILKNDGVQIFVATHSYMLAKYIDIKKQLDDDTLYISLYKDSGMIKTSRANSYSSLQKNPIEESAEKLFEAVVEKAMGEK